jgi:6-phosphogluconolactonase
VRALRGLNSSVLALAPIEEGSGKIVGKQEVGLVKHRWRFVAREADVNTLERHFTRLESDYFWYTGIRAAQSDRSLSRVSEHLLPNAILAPVKFGIMLFTGSSIPPHVFGRRHLLRTALPPAALWMESGRTFAANKSFIVYWGTYTEGGGQFGNGASKGIYLSRMETKTGRLTEPELAARSPNPSWLALHPTRRYLYAVNERIGANGKPGPGEVSAFAIDPKSAKLTEINRAQSRGGQPCHLRIDKTGGMLVVANWYTGSLASFPINTDGALREASGFCLQEGPRSGPAVSGPQTSHCHSVLMTPDNRFLLATNTGLNKVFLYRLDVGRAAFVAHDPPFLSLKKPVNPRHLALHPNGRWAYVANEINPGGCTMLHYDGTRGVLEEGPVSATVPQDYKGRVSTAECVVHPSGKFVYLSNRGHESIAVFKIDATDGMPSLVETFLPGGETPRSFVIDPTGRFLIAMMQRSNAIVPLRIDQHSGKLSPNGGKLTLPSPVCAVFS